MFTISYEYAIEKAFDTEEQAVNYVKEKYNFGNTYVISEVKQVVKQKTTPVELENVPIETFRKKCNCEESSVQAAIPN